MLPRNPAPDNGENADEAFSLYRQSMTKEAPDSMFACELRSEEAKPQFTGSAPMVRLVVCFQALRYVLR